MGQACGGGIVREPEVCSSVYQNSRDVTNAWYAGMEPYGNTIATLPWHGASISVKRELCVRSRVPVRSYRVCIDWVKPFHVPFPVCRTRRKRNTALTKKPCHIWRRHNVSDSFLTGTCADNRKQSFGSSCSLTIRFLIVSFKLSNCQISHKKRTNSYLGIIIPILIEIEFIGKS